MNYNPNPPYLNECILCGNKDDIRTETYRKNDEYLVYDCNRCGKFLMDEVLPKLNWELVRALSYLHLVSGVVRKHCDNLIAQKSLKHEKLLKIDSLESLQQIADLAPSSPREKALGLLSVLISRSNKFGESHQLNEELSVYCFAQDKTEVVKFALYLESQRLIQLDGLSDKEAAFRARDCPYKAGAIVTADGFEFSTEAKSPLTIFISSTVYDLLDLRAELAEHLESAGHVVRMSEDYERFEVDQKSDSIQQCLNNLQASEVVICLLDQRYGGVIHKHENQDWIGKSATQIEFEHARKLGLPVYAFIRDKAETDAGLLRSDIETKTRWVEAKAKKETREKWLDFYHSLVSLKGKPQEPNWYDPFRTSVDLKKLVDKRLNDFVKSR